MGGQRETASALRASCSPPQAAGAGSAWLHGGPWGLRGTQAVPARLRANTATR